MMTTAALTLAAAGKGNQTEKVMAATPNGHGRNGHTGPPGGNGVNRLGGVEARAAAPLGPSATAAAPPPAAAPDKPTGDGRGAGGKFAAGNHYGRGNPHARRMAALRQAFLSAATEDRMRALGERLYVAAVAGDVQAAKLFLLFVVGRPSAAVNPDALDLDEFRLLASAPSKGRVLLEIIDSLPPGPACDLLRAQARTAEDVDALCCGMDGEADRLQVFLDEREAKRAKGV